MKHAETVTFGGSNLNRAAHLRGPDALATLMETATTCVIVFWRGKPLVSGPEVGELSLSLVKCDAKILTFSKTEPIFLGLDEDGSARFAVDISPWSPAEISDQVGQFFDPSEQVHPDMPDGHRFADLKVNMTRISARDAELAATARGLLEWHRTHGFCSTCGAESKVVQGGWQSTCPGCGRHHFPRTDPVVIMLITNGNSVLMGRSPGWPEGMYSLLAGFMEPGETLEAAVRREVFEEAGVRVGEVSYLSSQPWPFPASLMIGCHGHATSKDITIDPVEIEEAIWVTREDMAEVFEGRHPKIQAAREGAIAHFLLKHWLADTLD